MTEQEQKAIRWMKNIRDDAVVALDHIAKDYCLAAFTRTLPDVVGCN